MNRRKQCYSKTSLDLQKQRDKFALAMCVGLSKDRSQLIAGRAENLTNLKDMASQKLTMHIFRQRCEYTARLSFY